MIQHTDAGQWLLPGGMVEPGESPRQTVIREINEELGIDVKVTALIDTNSGPEFIWTYNNGHQVCFVMSTFACEITEEEFELDAEEILDMRFVGENDWQALDITDWMKITLPHVFTHKNK